MTNKEIIKSLEFLDLSFEYQEVIDMAIEALKEQPEITRCRDCKNWKVQVEDVKGSGLGACSYLNANFVTGEGYCYWAERREDECIY